VIREAPLPMSDVALFCVLAGVAGTLANGYTYGEFNQVGHLPMIFRMMDGSYLANDFFVNAVDGFNPRFYYVWPIAAASTWVPTPVLFALLTCAANVLIAVVTWHIAWSMSGRSNLAAVLACAVVLAVNGFNEGGAAQIPRDFLGPSLLARPLAMLGLWLTITGRTVRPLLLFVAAIGLHPLVGAETAAIAVAAAGLALVARSSRPPELWESLTGKEARRLVVMVAAILTVTYLLYGGCQAHSVSTSRLIQVLADARGPHHYLPSRFGTGSHLAFGAFCLATLLSWLQWRRSSADQDVARAILAVGVVVLVACLGGYVFVEVFPIRVWVVAQPFRMTYLIKWFGFLLFACAAARSLRPATSVAERLSAALLVLGTGRYQPAIALMGNLSGAASRWLGAARRPLAATIAAGCAVAAAGLVIVPATSRPEEPFVLALTLGVGACFLLVESTLWRRLLPALTVGAGVVILVGFRASPIVIGPARTVGVIAPRMTLAESAKLWTEAARFARASTPEDAVFVVPPRLGGFRLVGRRAVVVDNKAFPFGDAAMEEWYERMLYTHAGRLEGALPTLMELDRNYAVFEDEHLVRVQQRYGATHALLWPQTATNMPVLYEDQAFKIVRIEAP